MKKFLYLVFLLLLAAFVIPKDSLAQVPANSWECVVGPGGTCLPNTNTATCTGNNIIPDSAVAYCAQFNGVGNTAQCNSAGGACVAPSPTPTPSYTCGSNGEPCCPGFTCDPGFNCNTRAGTCFGQCSSNVDCNPGEICSFGTCIGTLDDSPQDPRQGCGETSINTAIGCIPVGTSEEFIGFILRWAIGIGGGIAFLLILIAGFQIMTSQGSPDKLQAGKELLTSAIVGIILIIFSIFILELIGVDILGIPGFGN